MSLAGNCQRSRHGTLVDEIRSWYLVFEAVVCIFNIFPRNGATRYNTGSNRITGWPNETPRGGKGTERYCQVFCAFYACLPLPPTILETFLLIQRKQLTINLKKTLSTQLEFVGERLWVLFTNTKSGFQREKGEGANGGCEQNDPNWTWNEQNTIKGTSTNMNESCNQLFMRRCLWY